MLADHKWMHAIVAVIALSSVQAYAAETEEKDNYYLNEIKELSKDAGPGKETREAESDILAGADLEMKAEKPAFEKPKIQIEKPAIEKPKL
jgi:hypothetical protein